MKRPDPARTVHAFAILLVTVLALSSCDSETDPEISGLASRSYEETLSIAVSVDTVYVLLGTTEYQGLANPADVTLETVPVSGDALQVRLHIVGLSLDSHPRATLQHRWDADTLRVWCGYDEPSAWAGRSATSGQDPVQPPYFVPREVRIGSPADVEVRYLGQWFE